MKPQDIVASWLILYRVISRNEKVALLSKGYIPTPLYSCLKRQLKGIIGDTRNTKTSRKLCWLLGTSVLRKAWILRTDVPSSQHRYQPEATRQCAMRRSNYRSPPLGCGGHDEGRERWSGKRTDRRKHVTWQGEWKQTKPVPGKQDWQEDDPGSRKRQDAACDH
jgi:hypothetical protein